jgi:hypothetical protein
MSFFPFNPNVPAARRMQSDVPGLYTERFFGCRYHLTAAEAAVNDDDYFVVSVDMKVGEYTLAKTVMPGNVARNIIVTQTKTDTEDTNGTIVIVGTDLAGNAITETLTPKDGTVVAGAKCFRAITSMTGVGWAVDAVQGTKDKVKIGFGSKIGLPDLLESNTVFFAVLGGTREAVAPTVTSSTTALESNGVTLASALNGTAVDICYAV